MFNYDNNNWFGLFLSSDSTIEIQEKWEEVCVFTKILHFWSGVVNWITTYDVNCRQKSHWKRHWNHGNFLIQLFVLSYQAHGKINHFIDSRFHLSDFEREKYDFVPYEWISKLKSNPIAYFNGIMISLRFIAHQV